MGEFICTTILEFTDRYEGQVLHRGDKEACENVADMIPAVAVNGDEMPTDTRIVIAPAQEFGDLSDGELWRCEKKGESP